MLRGPQGPYRLPAREHDPETLNTRQILYEYWARYCRWYKYQPLDHVRAYYGEKIAFYFAWIGTRTSRDATQSPTLLHNQCIDASDV